MEKKQFAANKANTTKRKQGTSTKSFNNDVNKRHPQNKALNNAKLVKKFKPKTFQRLVPHNEFGKSLYDYVSRVFMVKDNQGLTNPNTYAGTLKEGLKEVKLIDKSIKRIKFKSMKSDEIVKGLKSLNDLHGRKKALLSIIAKANIENFITITIGDKELKMTLFAGRMMIKEMTQYANRIKDSRINIGNDNTESIVREINSVVIDIEEALDNVSKEIMISIPR